MIRWFSPHPLKSCWLLDMWSSPLVWHLCDNMRHMQFLASAPNFRGLSWSPDPTSPGQCLSRQMCARISAECLERLRSRHAMFSEKSADSYLSISYTTAGMGALYRSFSGHTSTWNYLPVNSTNFSSLSNVNKTVSSTYFTKWIEHDYAQVISTASHYALWCSVFTRFTCFYVFFHILSTIHHVVRGITFQLTFQSGSMLFNKRVLMWHFLDVINANLTIFCNCNVTNYDISFFFLGGEEGLRCAST